MKALTVSITLLANSLTFASSFKVIDPMIRSERVSVPIENITCEKGPFRMSLLQVKLPRQVGGPEQAGVLKSEFMSELGDDECNAIFINLLKFAHDGQVDLEATVEARSVVKLTEAGSYECEGAQQEVVSMGLGGVTVGAGVNWGQKQRSTGPMDHDLKS